MKKILVAIDFSEASRNALYYAAQLAKKFDGNLILLHAYYLPISVGDLPGYIPVSFGEVQEENEALLQREIEYLGEKYEVKVEGFVKMGTASAVIKDMADEINADLIVMGTKGAGMSGGIFGSTVISGIRKTKKPLLIIPENVKFSTIENISFAADFEKRSEGEQYSIMNEIAKEFNANIQIIHVQKEEVMMSSDELAAKIGANILFEKVNYSFHTVVHENIEKGIDEFLAGHPTDLLVMIAHHHNLFERLFGREHTKLIVYQTKFPLLILHD